MGKQDEHFKPGELTVPDMTVHIFNNWSTFDRFFFIFV